MPFVFSAILFACYLVAAIAVGLMTPALAANLSPMGISLGGATAAFLACLVGHLMVLRQVDREAALQALGRARGAVRAAERQAADLQARLGAIQSGLDSSSRRESAELIAAMQALQAELADFSVRAAAPPAPALAPVPPAEAEAEPAVAAPPQAPVGVPAVGEPEFQGLTFGTGAPRVADHAQFEAVRAAVADNRVDLHAREIVALPGHQTGLVDVFGQVRDARGAVLAAEDYLPAAARAGKAGPLDNLLLLRSTQLLRQIRRAGALPPGLLRISPNSLRDGDFFPQFVDFLEHNGDLNEVVIFALGEAAFEDLVKSSNPGLARLAAIGFTFCLDGITRLDHDAEALGALNVRYLRLAASDLFDDPEAAGALASRLEAAGIALIVDDVEDEETEAVLLENGIRLGGGPLYGSHRPALELAL